MWSPLASASLVFLVLYLIVFIILCSLFALRKVHWKSRWLVLLLHVLVRLASQACGLSFGLIGYRNIDLLIAYYVLGAEGYFTLVRNHWNGHSWIEPIDPTQERAGWRKRFKRLLQGKPSENSPTAKLVLAVDWLLVAANAIIVAGGSLSSGAYSSSNNRTQEQKQALLDTSKGMRAAGQAVFLTINTLLLVCIVVTIHQHRLFRFDDYSNRNVENETATITREKVGKDSANKSESRPWYAHPTLLLLLLTWPFLAVRGAFGVAQALLPDLNFFNSEVYDANNLTAQFVTEESCFVTMMEFISAAILTATYWTTLIRPSEQRTVEPLASAV
ncbi:uncharacterized protein UTRI_05380 [Ustilago trichophora]|uniref:Uncharacterized protein n=1 Tax=Ustilago trichophora TaxID=86804 RepID=A0A5C3EJG0_9BASI|nr:uncharacterized protein UTRI_05380 [Ustilago trichophora]